MNNAPTHLSFRPTAEQLRHLQEVQQSTAVRQSDLLRFALDHYLRHVANGGALRG
jgi:hypothetical protein